MAVLIVRLLASLAVLSLLLLLSASAAPSPEISSASSKNQENPTDKGNQDMVTPDQVHLSSWKPASPEKLKRGLATFLNQLNPAPYFVPVTPAANRQPLRSPQVRAVSSSIANNNNSNNNKGSQPAPELAAIVGDTSAESFIKGPPNRLSQTRPIGGPMRWGRR